MADVRRMEKVGNEIANRKFLATWDPREYPEPAVGDREALREFIWLKYEGSWTRKMERERLGGSAEGRGGMAREPIRGREGQIFRDGGLPARSTPTSSAGVGRRSYWAEKFDKADRYQRRDEGSGRRRDDYYADYRGGPSVYDDRGPSYQRRRDVVDSRDWDRREDPRDRYMNREQPPYRNDYAENESRWSRDRRDVYSSEEEERPRRSKSRSKSRKKAGEGRRRKATDGRRSKSTRKSRDKELDAVSSQSDSQPGFSSEEDRRSRQRCRARKKSSRHVESDGSDDNTHESNQKRSLKAGRKSSRRGKRKAKEQEYSEDSHSEAGYVTADSDYLSENGVDTEESPRKGRKDSKNRKDRKGRKTKKNAEREATSANGVENKANGNHAEFDVMSQLMDQPKSGPPQSSQLSGSVSAQSAPQVSNPPRPLPMPPMSTFPGMPMMMMPGPTGHPMMGPPMQPSMTFTQPLMLPNGSMVMPMLPQQPPPQGMPMMPTMPNGLVQGMQNVRIKEENGSAPSTPATNPPSR